MVSEALSVCNFDHARSSLKHVILLILLFIFYN